MQLYKKIGYICSGIFCFAAFTVLFSITSNYVARFNIQSAVEASSKRNSDSTNILNDVLAEIPSSSRIRVSFIHLDSTGKIPQFDVVYAVADSKHDRGGFIQDHNLTEWSDFLDVLLTGQCYYSKISNLSDAAFRIRLSQMTSSFVGCPIMRNGHLIGGIFMTWDLDQDVPADLKNTYRAMLKAANLLSDNL